MRKLIEENKKVAGKTSLYQPGTQPDSTGKKPNNDIFISEFKDEKTDSSKLGNVVGSDVIPKEPVLKTARVYEYRPPKFFNDYLVSGFNNSVLVNRFQPYYGPPSEAIQLSNNDPLNGI